jgi:hypothetical protein
METHMGVWVGSVRYEVHTERDILDLLARLKVAA